MGNALFAATAPVLTTLIVAATFVTVSTPGSVAQRIPYFLSLPSKRFF